MFINARTRIYKYLWYIRTPLIRINWDGEPSGYAEYPDNYIFFKIGYIGSFQFDRYCSQYVPEYKPFEHAWFEITEAKTLYCTWSDNR